MIKSITVTLITRAQSGEDPFHNPAYEEKEVEVPGVLVAPSSADDVISAQSLYGKKAVYTLAIPKGDENDWTDAEVRFFGRTWKTFGIPTEGIGENIPLKWNQKVMVERYE